MKKTIKFFIAAILAAVIVLPLKGAEDSPIIPIMQMPGTPYPNLGRGQVQQLFLAEYNDLWNCVILTCTESCGDVTVTLTSTAGDWYQTVFDTSDGVAIIPASGDSGNYTLSIVTNDGTHYVGEFIL